MAFVTWEDTVADGIQTDFTIIFPYLSRDHVEIKFNGSVQASSLYTFLSDTQIRFTSPPASGVTVRVGRNTPKSTLTDFKDGYLPESDLDNSYLQNLYHIQELQDIYDELIAGVSPPTPVVLLQDADADTLVQVEASADEDIIRFTTAGVLRGRFDSTGNFVLGLDGAGDGLVHIHRSSAGAVTAHADADELVIESGAGNMGIQFLGTTSAIQALMFGDSGDVDAGKLEYSHVSDTFSFKVGATSIPLTITSTGVTLNSNDDNVDVRIEGAGGSELFSVDVSAQRIGISDQVGLLPTDGLVHIQSGTAGSVTANTVADELVLESNAASLGMSFLSPNTASQYIVFGDADDNDVGYIVYAHGTDIMGFYTSAVERLRLGASEVVFNETGADVDFRVESDTNANMLFVDAGNNRLGIGAVAPTDGLVHIQSASAGAVAASSLGDELVIEGGTDVGLSILCSADSTGRIIFGDANFNLEGFVSYLHTGNTMQLGTEAATRLTLSLTECAFNDVGADTDFRIESDTQANKFYLDAGANLLQTRAGTAASGFGQIVSELNVATTEVGTDADTAEKVLQTFTIPGGSLQNSGDYVKFRCSGFTAANGNTKTLKIKVDGVTVYDSTAIAANNKQWFNEMIIIRTGAATATLVGDFGLGIDGNAIVPGYNSAALTPTWSGDVVIQVTGQNGTASANDLVCGFFAVDIFPSA